MELADFVLTLVTIVVILGIFISEISQKQQKSNVGLLQTAIFFPDEKMPCWNFYERLAGYKHKCLKPNCSFAHDYDNAERTSFMRLMMMLNDAQISIDLCVFEIALNELAKFLIRAQKTGIRVRVLVGRDKMHQPRAYLKKRPPGAHDTLGSWRASHMSNPEEIEPNNHSKDVLRQLENKVEMRMFKAPGLLLDKYVLIDNSICLFGSFSWTYGAVLYNHESIVFTNYQAVVSQFSQRFEKMWSKAEKRAPSQYMSVYG